MGQYQKDVRIMTETYLILLVMILKMIKYDLEMIKKIKP